VLKLEEPKSIMFRLFNLSPSMMKITLSVKEKEVGDILICGISKYVSLIAKELKNVIEPRKT
jgi:hypothetical protein